MTQTKTLVTVFCGVISLLGLPVNAANRVVEVSPNLGLSVEAETDASAGCLQCDGDSIHPHSLLHHILYFEDPDKLDKVIKTVPRSLKGPGSAGELGLAGVGVISLPGPHGGMATGFLISQCHVLTNFHVPFANDEEHPSSAVSVDFYYGQGRDNGFEPHVSASPVDHPESVGHGWGNRGKGQTRGGDWALLRLSKCVGSQIGFLTLLPAPFSEKVLGRNFETAGMLKLTATNKAYRNGLDVESSCEVVGYEHDIDRVMHTDSIEHYCASPPGSSGSPIYVRMKNGKPLVMAINSGDNGMAGSTIRFALKGGVLANVGVSINAIYPRLAALLKEEEGYVKGQTGQDWHFGDDLRILEATSP